MVDTFTQWTVEKLETLIDEPIVLVRDPLHLLSDHEGDLHRFAKSNGFTVLVASTNLVFRELLESMRKVGGSTKLLVVDRTPGRRRIKSSTPKAPALFYPDLLSKINSEAIHDVGMLRFLVEKTNDPGWPKECDDPRFAKLIADSIDSIIKAHSDLRKADSKRFTDTDFRTIVAYAALGVPEAAFKKKDVLEYWKIGLVGRKAMETLSSLAPDAAEAVSSNMRQAPAPFCWFADSPSEPVLRAFYLATILSQHCDQWKLMLPHIDQELMLFTDMDGSIITEAAAKLVVNEPDRAYTDLNITELNLSANAIQFIFDEQIKILDKGRFTEVIEKEEYSVLFRNLSLIAALDDLLSNSPSTNAHKRLTMLLHGDIKNRGKIFVENRRSESWDVLRKTYLRLHEIIKIKRNILNARKSLTVTKQGDLKFSWFWEQWNKQHLNKLEFFISDILRLINDPDFLPIPKSGLPKIFTDALSRIHDRIGRLNDEIHRDLAKFNEDYQQYIAANYTLWLGSDTTEVVLTSDFLRRCVKPYWDIEKERAAIFIFDGMRYDIWDELARPVFEDHMEIIADLQGCSLLPSETHISRKAISAGSYPDLFNMAQSESSLLEETLRREFGLSDSVEVVAPDGGGMGETVRYRAGNLDVFIFELCDKELHKIDMKTRPDGRLEPSRSLAFIYNQLIKNVIEKEVSAIIRELEPGTKVFVTADHGFGLIGRERIGINDSWLNDSRDCRYLNAHLKMSLKDAGAHSKVLDNVYEFPVTDLRLPVKEKKVDKSSGNVWYQQYASVIFPKTGYAFSRQGSPFRPDAYSHGGISLQEMFIPMIVLRQKSSEDSLFSLGEFEGQFELTEGEEAEFHIQVNFTATVKEDDIRLRTFFTYKKDQYASPQLQTYYFNRLGGKIELRFTPDTSDATDDERRDGIMKRDGLINVDYYDTTSERTIRKSRMHTFTVNLSTERVIRRVPQNLGKLLGMKPKGM